VKGWGSSEKSDKSIKIGKLTNKMPIWSKLKGAKIKLKVWAFHWMRRK
jgi:hypothetical protein